MEIRPATLDDAPEMARVIVDTWFAAHEGQVPDEKFQQRRNEWGYHESERGWRRLLREVGKALVLVATDDDKVVAVAATEIAEPDIAETGALYVDVPYQRSGIGRRLVATIMAHYRNRGIARLQIAVLAANPPARRFYESLGGEKVGTRDDPEGLEIVYAWDLTEP